MMSTRRSAFAISIHAPRTGSDGRFVAAIYEFVDFNPRSPHGERLCFVRKQRISNHFNPRSPHGERLR